MTLKIGSPVTAAGAVLVLVDFGPGAAARGLKESWRARTAQQATRKNSRSEKWELRWAGKDEMIFMNNSLPVQQYPKGR